MRTVTVLDPALDNAPTDIDTVGDSNVPDSITVDETQSKVPLTRNIEFTFAKDAIGPHRLTTELIKEAVGSGDARDGELQGRRVGFTRLVSPSSGDLD